MKPIARIGATLAPTVGPVKIIAALVASATLAAACSNAQREETAASFVTIALTASRLNAGEIGKAVIVPWGEASQVRIDISGVATPVTPPVQLYMFIYAGRCDSLAARPEYALTQRVAASSLIDPNSLRPTGRDPLTLTNTAPTSLEALQSSPHALVVQTSPADANVELFCGNI